MAEVKYEIIKNLGTIGEGSKGWKKEVNLISWNSRPAKVDIRSWDSRHEQMGKGVTLDKEELKSLKTMLAGMDIDSMGIE